MIDAMLVGALTPWLLLIGLISFVSGYAFMGVVCILSGILIWKSSPCR